MGSVFPVNTLHESPESQMSVFISPPSHRPGQSLGDIPVWHCQHRNLGSSHFPVPPKGAEAASPSRTLQSAGAGSCSRALGAEEIPAQLSLLTSVRQQLLPRPHSCAIHLQHTPRAVPAAAKGGCRAGPCMAASPVPPQLGKAQHLKWDRDSSQVRLCCDLGLGRGCSQGCELPCAFLASVAAAARQMQVFGT